jgi:hypothetical protein
MRADGGTSLTGAQPPGAPDLDNAGAFLAAAGLRLTHVAGDRVEGVADRGQIAVGTNNDTDFLRSMTTGTVAVTAAPVQQDEPSNCGTSASPTRAAEPSHEERSGCKTSSHDNETEDAAADTSCVRPAGGTGRDHRRTPDREVMDNGFR